MKSQQRAIGLCLVVSCTIAASNAGAQTATSAAEQPARPATVPADDKFDYTPFPEIPVVTVVPNQFVARLTKACAQLRDRAASTADADPCVGDASASATEVTPQLTTRERLTAIARDLPTTGTRFKDPTELQACRIAHASFVALRQDADALARTCAKLRGDRDAGQLEDAVDLPVLRKLRDDADFAQFMEQWGAQKFATDKVKEAAESATGAFQGPGLPSFGLGDLSDKWIRGLSDFIAERAKLETLRYVRRRLVEDLCTGLRKKFLSHTCASIEALDENQPLDGIGSYLKAGAEDDLRQLPDISLAYVDYKQPGLGELAFAGRVGVAFFETAQAGRDAPAVLADLAELPAQPCEGARCKDVASAVRFASALMYALQQGGENWEAAFEHPKAQDLGLDSVALMLLVEKRLEGNAHAGLPESFDAELLNHLIVKPVQIWTDAYRMEKRWGELKKALRPAEGTLSQPDQHRLIVQAIAGALSDAADLIDHTSAYLAKPPAPDVLLATQRVRALARVCSEIAQREYAPAMLGFLAQFNAAKVGASTPRLPEGLSKFVPFLVEVANADSSQGVAAAFESYAAPLGTYQLKYERPMVAINAAVGVFSGGELIDSHGVSGASLALSGFAPLGIHVTGPICDGATHLGLLLSIFDLGALTTYRFKDELDGSLPQPDDAAEEAPADPTANPTPKLGFEQIVAPGVFGTIALGGPFLLGAGVSLSPELREVTDRDVTLTTPAWRLGLFLAADVPVVPLN